MVEQDGQTRLVLVPPHGDITLAPEVPAGWTAVDIGRAFVQRTLQPDYLRGLADTLKRAESPMSATELERLLLLLAATVLLPAAGDLHSYLRAAGAALRGLAGPEHNARLDLDDLHLAQGTTERLADVLHAAQGLAPYQPDLDAALEQCRGAAGVCIWLERDQQLPAALALAAALHPQQPLEIGGSYAQSHQAVLRQAPALHRASFTPAALTWRVVGPPGWPLNSSTLHWQSDADFAPAPWAGYVPLEALLKPERLVERGCRVAVVSFCALSPHYVGRDGVELPAADVDYGARRLRADGVRIVAEWWIGAPGIDAAALARTLQVAIERPFFDWLAGVRLFHWSLQQPPATHWGAVDVKLVAPPPEHDLARSRPFMAAATLLPDAAGLEATALALQLARQAPFSPGRVAAAYVVPPQEPTAPPTGVQLSPDCAVVQLPAALDGIGGPTWYAANLRWGSVIALHPYVAQSLAKLQTAVPLDQALPLVPAAQRQRLGQQLIDKHILRGTGA